MSAPRVVTQMLAEAGLSDDGDLAAFLTALRALGDGPAPAPAPELAERLGLTPLARPRRWLRRRVVGGATALALAVVGGTGVAAAANELPPGVQRLMARFSAHFLPFDFPPPVESGPVPVHLGTRPADRADDHEAGLHGERPSGTDRAAMAAERSHRPGLASGGVPAAGDAHAGSGGAGTRSAADDGADGSGSDGGSGDESSQDGDGSYERTGGDTQQASEPDSGGSDGTRESSDGSGSTDEGSDGGGSDYGADSSDPDGDPDSPSESGGSSSGGG